MPARNAAASTHAVGRQADRMRVQREMTDSRRSGGVPAGKNLAGSSRVTIGARRVSAVG